METYRSGDVAERCQWQKKRGIRSGSGRNFVSESEQKISGTATGHNEAVLKICSREFLQILKIPCYA